MIFLYFVTVTHVFDNTHYINEAITIKLRVFHQEVVHQLNFGGKIIDFRYIFAYFWK